MKFLRAFLSFLLLSTASCVLALVGSTTGVPAQNIPPSPLNEERRAAFDLAQGYSYLTLWDHQMIASGEEVGSKDWTNGTFLCHSDTDPSVGACPTRDVRTGQSANGKRTEVRLMFVERRSRARHTVVFQGHKELAARGHLDSMRPLNEEFGNDGAWLKLNAEIPAAEFKRFPSGGIWEAHWKLRLHRRDRGDVSEVNVKIQLTITDAKNVQIFLPEHNTTTPTVDLGLSGQVSRDGRTTGRRNIDMCLYDGFGAHSSWFDVTIKDGLTSYR
ncbi:CfaE/CblD family pilus tip adhesin [Burkholderia gladioli]|uniref:CfaE/CblD family pilus tip adhesin n=1 Tax=Burkholderia gladioli TaxID=28095 RepID=UPI003F7A9F4F